MHVRLLFCIHLFDKQAGKLLQSTKLREVSLKFRSLETEQCSGFQSKTSLGCFDSKCGPRIQKEGLFISVIGQQVDYCFALKTTGTNVPSALVPADAHI